MFMFRISKPSQTSFLRLFGELTHIASTDPDPSEHILDQVRLKTRQWTTHSQKFYYCGLGEFRYTGLIISIVVNFVGCSGNYSIDCHYSGALLNNALYKTVD